MTQYNTLNVKLSNSQLNKLKSGIKNGTQVTLNLSSNAVGNSSDETNFSHKLLLIRKFQRLLKLSKMVHQLIIFFSKTQLPKMIQLGGSFF